MFLSQDRQRPAARQARTRPMVVETLEGRLVLSTLTVTNVNDSGTGSLRQAIISSNATTGSSTNTIDFSIGNSGVVETIALKSTLPVLTHPVVINGASEPGATTVPLVVVSGAGAGSSVSGFTFESTASGSTLEGVAVVGFSGFGVLLQGTSGVAVSSDFIGTANGTTATGNSVGLEVSGGLKNSIVNDTISGNLGDGVDLVTTNSDVIQGNMIGTNAAGNAKLGNGVDGLSLDDASSNTISGDTVSQNAQDGIYLSAGSNSNVIQGSFVGTNSAGNEKLGNGVDGLSLDDASSNLISGDTVSQNAQDGIYLSAGSNSNVIQGSFIGTDSTGKALLGNLDNGVSISDSMNNTIGGSTSAALDVISANAVDGVLLEDGSSGNVIEGDHIGTDLLGENEVGNVIGANPMGNGKVGVWVNDSSGNFIGEPGFGNTISANGAQGVRIDGSTATKNVVAGNLIGTDAKGQAALGNGTDTADEHSGVIIIDGASANTIGGTTTSARDVISGNGYDGVHICSGDNTNTVEGDYIGVGANGTLALGNGQVGVEVDSTSVGNVIGVSGAGNTIADNLASGVWLDDVGANNLVEYDLISGNGVGTDQAIAEMGRDGVRVDGSPSTTVIKACTIESNHDWGIYLDSSPTVQTSGNTIPTTGPLANGLGTIGS